MTDVARHEVCIAALADVYRGDGEILASPMGTLPQLGAKLARLTFEPDLMMTDGVASLVTADGAVEGWMPYRRVFDVVWSGKRHVVMGCSQIDKFGNQNISCIGDWAKPKVQLLGMRGAPGNTINHVTSYWVPKQSNRCFVEAVDVVSGIGYDRAAELGEAGKRFHEIRRVVSNLGVFDFATDDGSMRLASLHPGVAVDDVVASTGFSLTIPDDVPTTREPTDDELRLIRDVLDPEGKARKEVAV
jgi:acyl CoA:acetate/3-ketoacid CoA transferase beta subunit